MVGVPVKVNLTIQDAVAAANLLAGPLLRSVCSDSDLHRVQRVGLCRRGSFGVCR